MLKQLKDQMEKQVLSLHDLQASIAKEYDGTDEREKRLQHSREELIKSKCTINRPQTDLFYDAILSVVLHFAELEQNLSRVSDESAATISSLKDELYDLRSQAKDQERERTEWERKRKRIEQELENERKETRMEKIEVCFRELKIKMCFGVIM